PAALRDLFVLAVVVWEVALHVPLEQVDDRLVLLVGAVAPAGLLLVQELVQNLFDGLRRFLLLGHGVSSLIASHLIALPCQLSSGTVPWAWPVQRARADPTSRETCRAACGAA